MLPLSSEEIVKLIGDHLRRRNASRLPVLAVAAAYKAAEDQLAERAKPLRSHNAADEQTGARGDIEILAEDDSAVCPSLKEAFLVLRHAAEALHVLQIEESHE